MNDLTSYLAERWNSAPQAFPGQGSLNYLVSLQAFTDRLALEVHRQVNMSAFAQSGDYLTDHGPEHIRTVIQRASELVFGFGATLTPYESFMLLAAIQIHDAGNAYGRDEHERRAALVVANYGNTLGINVIERKWVTRIARAHGGWKGDKKDEDKDTIVDLPMHEPIMGQRVRVQLLAAIMRLADEFADDQTRAARFPLENGLLPKGAEIYHKYAATLHSVMLVPDKKRAELHFALDTPDAIRKWGKGKGEAYLLDEIFSRTLKTYDECRYCMRYIKRAPDCEGTLGIDAIRVQIEVMDDSRKAALDSPPIETIAYTLEQRGYPNSAPNGIHEICPETRPWTGERLCEVLEAHNRPNATGTAQ